MLREAEAAGRASGIAIQIASAQGGDEIEAGFAALQVERAQAIVVVCSAYLSIHTQRVAEVALKRRLPTISHNPGFASAGGLMSYGFDFREASRSATDIVDRILRGAKASDIPIQQVTKFRLIINQTTAEAVGLTIPRTLALRADEIVE